MSREQIEEMAREMCHLSAECKTCQICEERYHGYGELCYFQCMAKEIINHGYRKQSEWFSVDERLPETRETILYFNGQCVDACYFDGDSFMTLDTYESDIIYEVTHWMPLPEAPKMKGE